MIDNSYSLLHLVIFISCAFMPIIGYLLFEIWKSNILTVIHFTKYLFVDIIWKYTVISSKFIWNTLIKIPWNFIKDISISIYNFFKKIVLLLIEQFKSVFGFTKKIFVKVKDVSENIIEAGISVAKAIYKISEEAVSTGINIIEAIWNFISSKVSDIYNIIKSIVSSVIDFFKGIGDFFSSIIDTFLNLI